jgi:hypothetical protein
MQGKKHSHFGNSKRRDINLRIYMRTSTVRSPFNRRIIIQMGRGFQKMLEKLRLQERRPGSSIKRKLSCRKL